MGAADAPWSAANGLGIRAADLAVSPPSPALAGAEGAPNFRSHPRPALGPRPSLTPARPCSSASNRGGPRMLRHEAARTARQRRRHPGRVAGGAQSGAADRLRQRVAAVARRLRLRARAASRRQGPEGCRPPWCPAARARERQSRRGEKMPASLPPGRAPSFSVAPERPRARACLRIHVHARSRRPTCVEHSHVLRAPQVSAQLGWLLATTARYKTVHCKTYVEDMEGAVLVQCSYGNKCLFGHGLRDRRRDPMSHVYAPIMCPEAIADGTLSCKAGDACPYAHTPIELRAHPLVLLRELKAGKSPELMRLTQQAPGENACDSPGRGRRGRSGGVAAPAGPPKVQISLAATSGCSVSVVVAVVPPPQPPRHARSGGVASQALPSAAYPSAAYPGASSPTCHMCTGHNAHGMVNGVTAPSFNPYAVSPADVMVHHPHLYVSPLAMGPPHHHRQPTHVNGAMNVGAMNGATPPASPMHPPLPAGPPPPESYAARDAGAANGAHAAAPILISSPPPRPGDSPSEPASPMMLVVRRTPPVDLPAPHPSPLTTTTTPPPPIPHPPRSIPAPPPTHSSSSLPPFLPPSLPGCPRSRTPTAGRGARLKWRGRRGIAREKEESRATSGSCALDSRRCWGTMVTPPTPPRRPSACAENWRRPSKRTPSATTRPLDVEIPYY